jgi:hypothetical protein
MNLRSVRLSIIGLAVLAAMGAASAAPGPVFRHPDPSAPLAARWDWAHSRASGPDFRGGFWAAYSIRRRMPEDSFIGSWNWPRRTDDVTFADVISGKARRVLDSRDKEKLVQDAARKALDELEGRSVPKRIVDKDIAIVFKFGPSGVRMPIDVDILDVQSLFDPKGLPVFWLGPAADGDSIAALENFFSGPIPIKVKADIVGVVGMHQAPGLALPFLDRASAPANPEAVRREAASALGEQTELRAVDILRRMIAADPSIEIKKEAVSALGESSVPAALDLLIETALKAPQNELRREAIDGLAEKASQRAVEALGHAAFNDQDTEVQKEAISALAELPRKEALSHLTEAARTHPNPEVKKAAIEALGELGGPEVIAVLAELARGRK